MRKWKWSLFLCSFLVCVSAFAGNTINDVFTVTAVTATQATLTGEVQNLKVGDYLYFIRSPFKFKISAVGTNSVVIDVPQSGDVVLTNTMVRNPTPAIQKGLDTESKLKSALSD